MTRSEYDELVHGMLGYAEKCKENVAVWESLGGHAVMSEPARYLSNALADAQLVVDRLTALASSAPGDPA